MFHPCSLETHDDGLEVHTCTCIAMFANSTVITHLHEGHYNKYIRNNDSAWVFLVFRSIWGEGAGISNCFCPLKRMSRDNNDIILRRFPETTFHICLPDIPPWKRVPCRRLSCRPHLPLIRDEI